MSLFNYDKYKILIDPESKKVQGLQTGDVVRRQYYDGQNLIYSLMIVLQTGVDTLIGKDGKELRSPYFVGALIDGDEPQSGELLDFARMTNLFNVDRTGALYMTASDSNAPYLDIIDAIAIENSLCYPYMDGGVANEADSQKYAAAGMEFLTTQYIKSVQDVYRIFRIKRNAVINSGHQIIGFKQTLEKKVSNPQRIVISYKIRASRPLSGVELRLGYTNEREIDGRDSICLLYTSPSPRD